jgi:hypothetical protein
MPQLPRPWHGGGGEQTRLTSVRQLKRFKSIKCHFEALHNPDTLKIESESMKK